MLSVWQQTDAVRDQLVKIVAGLEIRQAFRVRVGLDQSKTNKQTTRRGFFFSFLILYISDFRYTEV